VPINLALINNGVQAKLLEAGAVFKPCFCGPCFGAGDVPSNSALSIRHTTRNFPNREGSKPSDGQLSGVALMDARSIAATARNGGKITAATDVDYTHTPHDYHFDKTVYEKRVYYGYGKADPDAELILGPNITDWPKQYPLADNLLVELAAVIRDPVTTTDELIPSGETSSYRSNPLRLSEFALSRRVPEYVGRSKAIHAVDLERRDGKTPAELVSVLSRFGDAEKLLKNTQFGSCVFANRPGDGSAREQAASCQRVIGGLANITKEYATKRYRSNVMNWGMIPFHLKGEPVDFEVGDYIYVPGIREALDGDLKDIKGYVIKDGKAAGAASAKQIDLYIMDMTKNEREIVKAGCLINFNKNRNAK
jgi:aconitate hydratase